jgi:hypothetical protein
MLPKSQTRIISRHLYSICEFIELILIKYNLRNNEVIYSSRSSSLIDI